MQTFLPYPNYGRCAEVLDNRRLGKQRVECLQILNALLDPYAKGWVNHPAVKMWRGYERELIDYGVVMCQAWLGRGFDDTCQGKIMSFLAETTEDSHSTPHWLAGDLGKLVCLSHQSNLIRKDPAHYEPLFPGIPDNLQYVWPV